jgi:hypothetical protein
MHASFALRAAAVTVTAVTAQKLDLIGACTSTDEDNEMMKMTILTR